MVLQFIKYSGWKKQKTPAKPKRLEWEPAQPGYFLGFYEKEV